MIYFKDYEFYYFFQIFLEELFVSGKVYHFEIDLMHASIIDD